MQASKIKPHVIYAINYDGKLVRFSVKAIVTRRVNSYGNPHDYESTVEGHIIERPELKLVTVEASNLLGPYEEQVELKARKTAEEAEKRRLEDEKEQRLGKLLGLLHEKLGMAPSEDEDRYGSYKHPLRISYNETIEIRGEALQRMIDYLERR